MMRAAIYNRCSTDMESQRSALETQVAESREIVVGMGWELVMQYVEAESATTKNRPLYQKMLEDISSHRFDVLVIKSIDRINRNVRDFYFLLDCLTQNKVRLYLYLERKYYDAGDSLITGIKAILAEDFSRELSKKIRNAHERRQKLQSGLNITRKMYGWDKIGKDKFELNEREAKYYRQAFDLARDGYGYRRIAGIMYERGARAVNGGQLSEVQWRNMLRSPRAHGEVILKRDWYNFETKKREKLPTEEWIHINDALPAIISEESHREILEILDTRAKQVNEANQFRRGNGERGKGIFANKLECACCGKHYYRVKQTTQVGSSCVWKCASYINHGKKSHSQAGCDNVKLQENVLKEYILEECNQQLTINMEEENHIISETLNVLRRVMNNSDITSQIKSMQNSHEKLLQKKERLLTKLLDGTITDADYKRADRRLQQDIDTATLELNKCEQEQDKNVDCEERIKLIHKIIIQENYMEEVKTRCLIRKIHKIEVFQDGKMKIHFVSYL
jgi:DNA invertase Pin-like site-specific DNA recombinase